MKKFVVTEMQQFRACMQYCSSKCAAPGTHLLCWCLETAMLLHAMAIIPILF